jgi:pimeloyl-ACP methyl ester carboxylesterase
MLLNAIVASIAASLTVAGPLAPAEHRLDIDGVQLRYVTSAQGPMHADREPVLLVHGFWDSAAYTWLDTGLFEAAGAVRPAVAIDCRGHGGSDKPHDPALYGAAMAHDLGRVLDDIGADRAHIVGHSMGAHIALRFAVDHPDRVASLTLIGAGAAPAGGDPALMDRIAHALESGPTLRPIIEFIWPGGAPADAEVRAIDAEAFSTNDPRALAAVARAYGALTVTDAEARAIAAPITIIVGTRDPMIDDARRLATIRPCSVVEIDGADHIDVLHRPETAAALRIAIAGPR